MVEKYRRKVGVGEVGDAVGGNDLDKFGTAVMRRQLSEAVCQYRAAFVAAAHASSLSEVPCMSKSRSKADNRKHKNTTCHVPTQARHDVLRQAQDALVLEK